MRNATKAPSEGKFHSIKSIAEHFSVSPRTVRRWIEKGDLLAHKIGGAVRISEENRQRLIARGKPSEAMD